MFKQDLVFRSSIVQLIFEITFVQIIFFILLFINKNIFFLFNIEFEFSLNIKIMLFIFQYILILFFILQWYFWRYILTQSELINEKGVILKNKDSYNIRNIENIRIKQGLMGRIFNFADIEIYSPTFQKIVKLKTIDNPEDIVKSVNEILILLKNQNKDDLIIRK